jgi:hypothetical protein
METKLVIYKNREERQIIAIDFVKFEPNDTKVCLKIIKYDLDIIL